MSRNTTSDDRKDETRYRGGEGACACCCWARRAATSTTATAPAPMNPRTAMTQILVSVLLPTVVAAVDVVEPEDDVLPSDRLAL